MPSLCNEFYTESNLQFIGVNSQDDFVFVQSDETIALAAYKDKQLVTLYDLDEFEGGLHYHHQWNAMISLTMESHEVVIEVISLDGILINKFSLLLPIPIIEPVITNMVTDPSDPDESCIYVSFEDEHEENYWVQVNLMEQELASIPLPYKEIEMFDYQNRTLIIRHDRFPESPGYTWRLLDEEKEIPLKGKYHGSNQLYLMMSYEEDTGSRVEVFRKDTQELFKSFYFEEGIMDCRLTSDNTVVFIVNCSGVQKIKLGKITDENMDYIPHIEGRLDISNIQENKICLYRTSLLGGSEWVIIDSNQSIVSKAGMIPGCGFLGERHTYDKHIIYVPSIPIIGGIISLHGGPESCEFDEIRYWGLYRDLLEQGVLVCVLNYYGSSSFGYRHRSYPWQDWCSSFSQELGTIFTVLESNFNLNKERISMFGVSFGGALALASPVIEPRINAVVAVAPLINLEAHIHKLKDDYPNMVNWFAARFLNPNNILFLSEDYYLKNSQTPVTVVQGTADEIFNSDKVVNLVYKAIENGYDWNIKLEDDAPHHPEDIQDCQARYENILSSLQLYL